MTVTKKYCDHCGKELNEMVDFTDADIEVAHRLYTVDLCEECFENLNNLVHAFVTNKGKVDAA